MAKVRSPASQPFGRVRKVPQKMRPLPYPQVDLECRSAGDRGHPTGSRNRDLEGRSEALHIEKMMSGIVNGVANDPMCVHGLTSEDRTQTPLVVR